MDEREVEILKSEGIIEAYKTVAEYRLLLDAGFGDASQTVWFRVVEHEDGRFSCDQSHGILTPTQAGPYFGGDIADTAEDALRRTVHGMLMFYNGAKKAGHEPSQGWFVPHADYRSFGAGGSAENARA